METPYGPVRQQNSGWFAWEPKLHRLTAFGTHPSTNPWGVTFDDWGQHVASYPIFASAHHALDPPYPEQHPKPSGMQAYSGVCGQEFIDFPNWPKELQGMMVKVRYKSTNRVELLKWKEYDYAWDHKSGRISMAKLFLEEAASTPIPLPDTAVLVQLLAGARQCDINITDTAYWKLEQLVKSRCRVEVKLP